MSAQVAAKGGNGNVGKGLAAIGVLALAFSLVGGCVGYGIAMSRREPDASVRELRQFPATDESGSDAIATGGLWEGAALYDVTLTDKAHLVVLYDNTTGSVAMVPWPDPTSPETGWLYVSPLDREAVLARIADRDGDAS